jgi:hypothetical protein
VETLSELIKIEHIWSILLLRGVMGTTVKVIGVPTETRKAKIVRAQLEIVQD